MAIHFAGHCCHKRLCGNIFTTPITAMRCRNVYLTLFSVVHLKGKHCKKKHCRNWVVNTFGLCALNRYIQRLDQPTKQGDKKSSFKYICTQQGCKVTATSENVWTYCAVLQLAGDLLTDFTCTCSCIGLALGFWVAHVPHIRLLSKNIHKMER